MTEIEYEEKDGKFQPKNQIVEYKGPRKVGQSTAIEKKDRKGEIKKKAGKVGTKIEKVAQAYNRGIEDLGTAIKKHYDPDKVLSNVWNMDAAYDLFGVKKRGQGNKKDV